MELYLENEKPTNLKESVNEENLISTHQNKDSSASTA